MKGTQALLTSHGWDKAGLYVQDGILTLKPDGANMRCDDDALQANKWTYVGMTRSNEGKITLFVNGYPCALNTVPFLDYYSLSPMAIEILRDEYGRNPTGGCSLITFYDRALDGVEVAKACECSLPPLADKKSCPNHVALNVVYAQMRASSVYDDKSIGDGYGRGRLNSRSAWRPKTNGKDQWLQMDSGETQTIAGVVTQGRRDTSEW